MGCYPCPLLDYTSCHYNESIALQNLAIHILQAHTNSPPPASAQEVSAYLDVYAEKLRAGARGEQEPISNPT